MVVDDLPRPRLRFSASLACDRVGLGAMAHCRCVHLGPNILAWARVDRGRGGDSVARCIDGLQFQCLADRWLRPMNGSVMANPTPHRVARLSVAHRQGLAARARGRERYAARERCG